VAREYLTVFIEEETWRIGRTGSKGSQLFALPAADEPGEMASNVAAQLRSQGYRGEEVVLAPPAGWCLCAHVAAVSLPRKHPRSVLLYRFEEKLPVAMEDLVADFATAGPNFASRQVLGVAVQLCKLQPIVDALEHVGIAVDVICPAALLALLKLQKQPHECDVVIWDDDKTRHLFVVGDGQVHEWRLLTLQWQELQLNLDILAASTTAHSTIWTFSRDAELKTQLSALRDFQIGSFDSLDLMETATTVAPALRSGKTPLINLRRDALAVADAHRNIRLPLTTAVISCILFLATLFGAMLHRAYRYHQIAQGIEERQRQVFHQLWPGQSAPTSIKSRLISEEAKLRGLSGEVKLSNTTSALALFHEMLKRLPTAMRFRVLEIRCGADGVYIEGEARSHGEADAIASALRKQELFKVEGPRTEQLAGQGVSFTINASYSPTLKAELLALQSHEKR